MSSSNSCVKCGCADIIQQAVVSAYADNAALPGRELQVRVDAHPDALLFRKPVRSGVVAHVCAGCGYMEFYATDPEALRKAFLEARGTGLNLSR